MSAKSISRLSDCLVIFDFDNTVTPFDILDDIIRRFSVDKKWVSLEDAWLKERISSAECLRGQLNGVRISRRELGRYLDKVRISPYFSKIIGLLRRHGARADILSDDFEFVIRRVLRKNRIRGVRICANSLSFKGRRLIPSFPHKNMDCLHCAHCKTKNLSKGKFRNKILIYIGDGNSDICPAKEADIVFAKGRLLEHFRNGNLNFRKFNSLREIYGFFRRIDGAETKN